MKNLESEMFGRLLVLKWEKKDERSRNYWACRCLCGNYVVVREDSLTSGQTKGCGCVKFLVNDIRIGRKEIEK